jgi:hypothetical protein
MNNEPIVQYVAILIQVPRADLMSAWCAKGHVQVQPDQQHRERKFPPADKQSI